MGAEENSWALSVKKGFAEGIFENCILCFKKHSLAAVDLWSELWWYKVRNELTVSSLPLFRRRSPGRWKQGKEEMGLQRTNCSHLFYSPSEYLASCCPGLMPMKMKVHYRRDMASQSVLDSWQRSMVSLQLWHWQRNLNLSNLSSTSWNGTVSHVAVIKNPSVDRWMNGNF